MVHLLGMFGKSYTGSFLISDMYLWGGFYSKFHIRYGNNKIIIYLLPGIHIRFFIFKKIIVIPGVLI